MRILLFMLFNIVTLCALDVDVEFQDGLRLQFRGWWARLFKKGKK